jgi:phosphoserine phosphatase
MSKNKIKIIVFDMDGVLVDIESSWQYVHKAFNVNNQDNLRRYLEGKITYSEFMKRDIFLWGPIHISKIKQVLDQVPLMKGAKSTISKLRKLGYTTCIISGGISILAQRVQKELGIDYTFANRLITDEKGMLVGEGEEIVNLLNKISVLRKFASDQGTTPRSCAIVGDSVFDIKLFEEAGLSIAFNASNEKVKQAADVIVNNKDLTRILPYFV